MQNDKDTTADKGKAAPNRQKAPVAKTKAVPTPPPKTKRTRQQTGLIIIGVLIISSMGLSAVAPFLQTTTTPTDSQPTQVAATPTPLPTPIADLSAISFDKTLVHPSGLFTVAEPSGWTPNASRTTAEEAQMTLRNDPALSVVEYRLVKPATPPTSAEAISEFFNATWLAASWRDYTRWTEATRTLSDNELVMDFNLQRGAQEYIARQLAYTDGTFIYGIRVVAPPNASEMVRHIVENARTTFQANPQFASLPLEWNGYFDPVNKHLVRYPTTWALEDAANGAPASFTGGNARLRIEVINGSAIESAEAAQAFIEASQGVSVTSVQERDQFGTPAYAVSYSTETADGEPVSGLAVVMMGEAGQIHLANVRLNGVSLDLNETSEDAAANEARQVAESFALLNVDAEPVQ